MRSFARPFTVLMAMVLFQAPAFAQVDMGQNIQNLPENVDLESLQDVDVTRGIHLLTIHVPLHVRDLHQEIERIRVKCNVDDDNPDNDLHDVLASGYTDVSYRGRTVRTTVSVPLEFPEDQEGSLTLIERVWCMTFLETADGEWDLPDTDAADPRFLLDEASTGPFTLQRELPL